jgi:outer membrane protein OmpA-like peptidoglycan-associated protein
MKMPGSHNSANRCILLLCLLLYVGLQADAQIAGPESPDVQALIEALRPLPTTRGIPSSPTVASAALAVEFEPRSVRLTEQGRRSLDTLGTALASDVLVDYEFRIEVRIETLGKPARDELLSKRQANAIKDYLVKQHQLSPRRLTTEGRGSAPSLEKSSQTSPLNVVVINAGSAP